VRVDRTLDIPGSTPPPVLVAALGPAMLRLAGAHADGTVTWMTGISTIASHIAPTLHQAATEAGDPRRGWPSPSRSA